MSKKPMKDMVKWVKEAPGTLRKKSHGPHYAPTTQPAAPSKKQWVHPPDVLNYGRVEYAVRFLGDVEVQQAKGTEVIKEAIQKIRFNLQLQRSQAGAAASKPPKVSLHINVDGVTISEPKSRLTLHKYPLHRISFCADDKADKRLFSFIAKGSDAADGRPQHRCFVFLSERLAEEITLTIGEAFDLAYRKFLDKNGRDLETKKQLVILKRRVVDLEEENSELKAMLPPGLLNSFLANQSQKNKRNGSSSAAARPEAGKTSWEDFGAAPPPPTSRPPPPGIPLPAVPGTAVPNGRQRPATNADLLQDLSANGPSVGAKLENLQLDEMEDIFDDDFDPRAGEPRSSQRAGASSDPFGLNPFLEAAGPSSASLKKDEEPSPAEMEAAIAHIDSRLAEMAEGFQAGLSIGNDADLNSGDPFGDLGDLDPFAQPGNNGKLP